MLEQHMGKYVCCDLISACLSYAWSGIFSAALSIILILTNTGAVGLVCPHGCNSIWSIVVILIWALIFGLLIYAIRKRTLSILIGWLVIMGIWLIMMIIGLPFNFSILGLIFTLIHIYGYYLVFSLFYAWKDSTVVTTNQTV